MKRISIKKTKYGFTLVELVVVIAILAIISAIAVPAVVGIITSATSASGETQADTLNKECLSTYAGIKAGTINNTTSKNADGTAVTFAAAKGDNFLARTRAANNATLGNVKTYAGMNIDTTDYYYCTATSSGSGISVGTIVFSDTGSAPVISGCTFGSLDDNVILANICN